MFVIFLIGSIAETNRAPFDLAEAESELVSGFMTEHAAVIFVFFFLAEYASIVLICVFTSILFLGGYTFNYIFIIYTLNSILHEVYLTYDLFKFENFLFNPLIEGSIYGIILSIKTSLLIFMFIWIRASFPRIRFDQLMLFC